MQQFTLVLKDSTQKAFNSFIWFLTFLHLVIIGIIIRNTTDNNQRIVAWATAALLIIVFLLLYFPKSHSKLIIFQSILFLVMATFWIAQLAWLPIIILIASFGFAYFVLQKKSMVVFSGDQIIIIRSLFKKAYNWNEINHVVLKDHLLSIDFNNNHLMQVEITPESFQVDETAFNQYCLQQLGLLKFDS